MKGLLERMSAWLVGLFHWVEGLAQTPQGPVALFLIAFAESSFFPVPPDVLLIPLCLGRPEMAFWFAGLCSAGSVLGAVAGYGIGYYGGRPLLLRLFNQEKIEVVSRYYDRYNAWAIGVAGLTPLPFKLFTISGGVFAINLKVFTVASILSRSLRFFAVAGLIYLFGEPIQSFIDRYLNIISIVFVILLVGGFWLVGRGFGRIGTREGAEPVEAAEAAEAAAPGAGAGGGSDE